MKLGVWMALVVLASYSAGPGHGAEPEWVVTTTHSEVKVLKCEQVRAGWLQNEGGALPARDPLKAEQGKALLRVRVEVEFKEGPEWMLAGFFLREVGAEDKAFNEVAIPLIGFTAPDQRAGNEVFFRAETGAAAVLVAGKIMLLTNKVVGGARRVRFMSLDADEGRWPGGRATLDLLFSVPNPSKPMELLKLQFIRISQPDAKLPDSGRLPKLTAEVHGPNVVRVVNPNAFGVSVFLRVGRKGRDFDVPVQGTAEIKVPHGAYKIYFRYANEPEALYQGEDFTLEGRGVEIRLVRVAGGNYSIRKVNKR